MYNKAKKERKPEEGKWTYTPLNEWIMNLSAPERKIFQERIYNNEALLGNLPNDKEKRRRRINNWRYKEGSCPSYADMILIYTSALYADPDLDIKTIFPDIPDFYTGFLLVPILQQSVNTNNFSNYVENKRQQHY